MKKICIVFMCLTLMLSMVGFATAVNNDIIYVDDDGGADYTTIQEAINVVSDGDTIYVYPGIYYGVININKSITLTGEDKTVTIIDGQQLGEDMITVTAPNVHINDFTIRNGPRGGGYNSGIKLEDADNSILEDIIFTDNCWAAEIRTSEGCIFSNNQVVDNEQGGVHIVFSDSTTVTNCSFMNNKRRGIQIAKGCNQVISSNTFIDCSVEVYDSPPQGNDLQCTMTDNTVNGKPLVYLERKNIRLVRNAGQVILNRCNGIIVRNNDLTNTAMGVQVLSSTFVHIVSNTIRDNLHGISVSNSFFVTIRNNDVQDNCYSGVGLFHSGGCQVILNEISGNDYGVYFYGTGLNMLCLNRVHDNERYNYWIDSIFLPNHIEL